MSGGEDYKNYGHLFVFSGANKAGMQGIDKEKQAQIIYEMSKNSAYFKRLSKIDESTSEKVKAMQAAIASITPSLQQKLEATATRNLMELEKKRCFDRICCVLDMDMFYAAVEIRDQPHLKDLPVAVGGDMMISTANYVARKYGVRAAMPGFIAKKLCPELVYVKCNFPKYEAVSAQLRAIIAEYDPDYSSHSLDEVYFDLTNAAKKRLAEEIGANLIASSSSSACVSGGRGRYAGLARRSNDYDSYISDDEFEGESDVSMNGPPAAKKSRLTPASPAATSGACQQQQQSFDIVELRRHAVNILQEIRMRIFEVTGGLTASAGIANNFFLAKICADINKPNGQYELGCTRDAVMSFITPLSCRKVGGIGKVTENVLDKLGMKTLGDLRENLFKILHAFSPTSAKFLSHICLGIAEEEDETDEERRQRRAVPEGVVTRKSISCDRTYSAKGISDPQELSEKLRELSEHLHLDMVKENLWGKTVTLKLKTVTFELLTRNITHHKYIQSAEDIKALAQQVLDGLMPVNIRLMGVSVRNFKDAYDPEAVEVIPGQRSVKQFFSTAAAAAPAGGGASSAISSSSSSSSSRGVTAAAATTTCAVSQSPSNSHAMFDKSKRPSEVIDLEDTDTVKFDVEGEDEDGNFPFVLSPQRLLAQEAQPGLEESEEEAAAADEEEQRLSQHLADVYTYVCPVCSKCIYGSNEDFNAHIDTCLTESAGFEVAPSNSVRNNSVNVHRVTPSAATKAGKAETSKGSASKTKPSAAVSKTKSKSADDGKKGKAASSKSSPVADGGGISRYFK